MPVSDLRGLLDFMADAGAWIAVADVCLTASELEPNDDTTANPEH